MPAELEASQSRAGRYDRKWTGRSETNNERGDYEQGSSVNLGIEITGSWTELDSLYAMQR